MVIEVELERDWDRSISHEMAMHIFCSVCIRNSCSCKKHSVNYAVKWGISSHHVHPQIKYCNDWHKCCRYFGSTCFQLFSEFRDALLITVFQWKCNLETDFRLKRFKAIIVVLQAFRRSDGGKQGKKRGRDWLFLSREIEIWEYHEQNNENKCIAYYIRKFHLATPKTLTTSATKFWNVRRSRKPKTLPNTDLQMFVDPEPERFPDRVKSKRHVLDHWLFSTKSHNSKPKQLLYNETVKSHK